MKSISKNNLMIAGGFEMIGIILDALHPNILDGDFVQYLSVLFLVSGLVFLAIHLYKSWR